MYVTHYSAVYFKTDSAAKTISEGLHMSSDSITLRATLVKMIFLKLANANSKPEGKGKAEDTYGMSLRELGTKRMNMNRGFFIFFHLYKDQKLR